MVEIIICGLLGSNTALLIMIYLLLKRIYPLFKQSPTYIYTPKMCDSDTKMRVISPYIAKDRREKGGDND